MVRRWHGRGRAVNVWTVDDPREIAWLAALGVDGIITNRPDVARAVIHGAQIEYSGRGAPGSCDPGVFRRDAS